MCGPLPYSGTDTVVLDHECLWPRLFFFSGQMSRMEQGHSKLFQGGVVKVYVLHVVCRAVWRHAPQGNQMLGDRF